MANESAGTLSVAITGDISALLTALDQATTAATTAGTAIAEALTAPAGGTEFTLGTEITEQLQTATEAAQTAGAAIEDALSPVDTDATSAADSIEQIGTSLESIAPEASAAADALGETATAADDVGESATAVDDVVDSLGEIVPAADDAAKALDDAAASSNDVGASASNFEELNTTLTELLEAVTGLTEAMQAAGESTKESGDKAEESGIEWGELYEKFVEIAAVLGIGLGLEELGDTALEGASKVQQLTTTFTLLTGSAQTASEQIETLKDMALQVHQPFEDVASAAQQMSVALGGFDNALPLVKAAGDAANYMGTSFDSAASKLDRMALSGTASAKSLATLGLSTADLAKAFNDVGNVAGATASNITAAFKALDVSDRIAVIIDAMQKMSQASDATSGNMKQEWTDFKTQFEYDMEEIGTALEPFISMLLVDLQGAFRTVLPSMQAFGEYISSSLDGVIVGITTTFHNLDQATTDLTTPLKNLASTMLLLAGIDPSSIQTWASQMLSFSASAKAASEEMQVIGVALLAMQGATVNTIESLLGLKSATDTTNTAYDTFNQSLGTAATKQTDLVNATTPLPPALQKIVDASGPASTGVAAIGTSATAASSGVNNFATALGGMTTATQTWYQEAHAGVTAIEEVQQALQTLGLSDQTVNGLMLQLAADTDTSTASFTQFGTALPLTTEVTAGLSKTAAAAAAQVLALGQELYGVSENGKIVVPILQSTSDALGVITTKGAAAANTLDGVATSMAHVGTAGQSAAAAITSAGAAQVFTNDKMESGATALSNVNAQWDANAAKVGSATDAINSASNANTNFLSSSYDAAASFDAVGNAAQTAMGQITDFTDALDDAIDAETDFSGSIGGGGGGKGGGGTSDANTLSSYLQAGATASQVNALAASMGLIQVGQNMFDTLDQYNAIIKATGLELNNLGQLVQINASATSNNTGATNTNTTATSAAATATTGAATTMNGIQPIIVSTGAAVTALGNAATDASTATEDTTTSITATGKALNDWQPVIVQAGTYGTGLNAAMNTATVATTSAASALSQLGTVAVENSAAMTSVANKTTTTYDNATDALTAFYEQVGMTTQAATALATAMTTVVHMSSAPTGTLGTTLNTAPLASQTPVENGLSMTLGPTQSGFNLYGQPISAPGYSAAPTTWTGVGSGLGNNPTQVFNVNVQSPSYQQTANQIVSALRNNASLKI